MNSQTRSTIVMIATLATVGLLGGLLVLRVRGGEKPTASKPPEPASVAKPVKETDLNVVALTPEAVKRIELKTAKITRERRPQTRTFPGEIILPPGRSVVVTAPVAGTVRLAGPAALPSIGQATTLPAPAPSLVMPGARVGPDVPVFLLFPELTSEARATIATSLVDAEGQVRNADVQRKAAAVALDRAKQLFADQAGTQRAVDEAQAAFDLADQTVKAAEARKAQLGRTSGQTEDGSVSPLVVASPMPGMVTAVRATPGQVVAAGASLFEVADPSRLWVRVTAGAGDASVVDADRPATMFRLSELTKQNLKDRRSLTAEPTGAPPIGAPLTSTVDLTYALPDSFGAPLTPGERVSVALPLRDQEESLVVPWSAVVFDLHGGAWIYEVVGTRQYARRRVDVRHVDDKQAILSAGPAGGTEVVVQGATELFGREMGFAK